MKQWAKTNATMGQSINGTMGQSINGTIEQNINGTMLILETITPKISTQ